MVETWTKPSQKIALRKVGTLKPHATNNLQKMVRRWAFNYFMKTFDFFMFFVLVGSLTQREGERERGVVNEPKFILMLILNVFI